MRGLGWWKIRIGKRINLNEQFGACIAAEML